MATVSTLLMYAIVFSARRLCVSFARIYHASRTLTLVSWPHDRTEACGPAGPAPASRVSRNCASRSQTVGSTGVGCSCAIPAGHGNPSGSRSRQPRVDPRSGWGRRIWPRPSRRISSGAGSAARVHRCQSSPTHSQSARTAWGSEKGRNTKSGIHGAGRRSGADSSNASTGKDRSVVLGVTEPSASALRPSTPAPKVRLGGGSHGETGSPMPGDPLGVGISRRRAAPWRVDGASGPRDGTLDAGVELVAALDASSVAR